MSLINEITIADLHVGDQLGLCPPKFKLRYGGWYRYSKFQKFIYDCWLSFWNNWVPMVTRGEEFCVVINGDIFEGRHHRITHAITEDKSDQEDMGYELLAPIRDSCEEMYIIGGTDAHAGIAAEDEERFAERLDAKLDESGNRSRFELFLEVGDAICHFAHHIGVTSSMAYESTALGKEYTEFCGESARWNDPVPDIVVRSHRHRHIESKVSTAKGYGIIFITAGWQLKTPFIYRTPGGRVTSPMLGGSLIRQGDEEFYTRHMIWKTKRARTEVAGGKKIKAKNKGRSSR